MKLRYAYQDWQQPKEGEAADPPKVSPFVVNQRMRVHRAWRNYRKGRLNRVQWALIVSDATIRILGGVRRFGYDHLRGREVTFVSGIYWPLIAINGTILEQTAANEHEDTWGPLQSSHGVVIDFLRSNDLHEETKGSRLQWSDDLIDLLREADRLNGRLGGLDGVERRMTDALGSLPTLVKVIAWGVANAVALVGLAL